MRKAATWAKSGGREADILISTTKTYIMHKQAFLEVDWHLFVLDEAHALKNPKTQVYKACMEVGTLRRYGLTGTPMQNNHRELFTLLNWAVPGRLGEVRAFMDYYVTPMKLAQSSKARAGDKELGAARRHELYGLYTTYLLRRTKDLILKDQLPQKKEFTVFCVLAPIQIRAYKRLYAQPEFQALAHCTDPQHVEPCEGAIWRHYHECPCTEPECRNRKSCCERCPVCLTFPCLILLLKVANHLELIKVDPQVHPRGSYEYEWRREVAELALRDAHCDDIEAAHGLEVDANYLHLTDSQMCGKLAVLEVLLAKWKQEDPTNKVLIFSSSVRFLHVAGDLVESAYPGAVLLLSGETSQAERQELVDRFNSTPASTSYIFLLSTGAGGVGINLTAANKVCVCDPSWNPARDMQAQDRAFRIGQKREVSVYRLVGQGTIEEVIYSRSVYKQQQTAIALHGTKEKRFFEGVQGLRGHEGELWGMGNLFSAALHDNLFTQQAATHSNLGKYRIEAYNPCRMTVGKGEPVTDEEEEEEEEEEGGVSGRGRKRKVRTDQAADYDELEAVGVVAYHRHDALMHRAGATQEGADSDEDTDPAVVPSKARQPRDPTAPLQELVAWMEGVPWDDAVAWLDSLSEDDLSKVCWQHDTDQVWSELGWQVPVQTRWLVDPIVEEEGEEGEEEEEEEEH